MLFSEAVTSKPRFMQSSGVREEREALLICPRRHSNRARSDTSINSPSSTKFTLVFRTPHYFISSCRISQSYFQSRSCHRGVAAWQLVVIMTIYSSGSEELFILQFSRPKEEQCGCSLTLSFHMLLFVRLPSLKCVAIISLLRSY